MVVELPTGDVPKPHFQRQRLMPIGASANAPCTMALGDSHKTSTPQFLALAAAATGLPAAARIAKAQSYPTRPVTLIVPWPAGGPSDTITHHAEPTRAALSQPVIVENVAGASGSIGVGRVARAAADGYTLCLGSWPTHVVNGAVFTLQYNVLNDFEPVSLIAAQPQLITAKKAMPANELTELIAWLRANPDKASQGTSGAGSPAHVAGAYFQKETGTRFQFVPYRGVNLAVQDLLAGQIDMMIDLASNSLPQVRAGTLKAYAVTAKRGLQRRPTSQRSTRRVARILHVGLACNLCTQGYSNGCRRQA